MADEFLRSKQAIQQLQDTLARIKRGDGTGVLIEDFREFPTPQQTLGCSAFLWTSASETEKTYLGMIEGYALGDRDNQYMTVLNLGYADGLVKIAEAGYSFRQAARLGILHNKVLYRGPIEIDKIGFLAGDRMIAGYISFFPLSRKQWNPGD